MSRPRGRFVCLCCGEKGLNEAPDGMTYDICSNCGWEDDTTDPDQPSGANSGMTMREWRRELAEGPWPPPRTRAELPGTEQPGLGGSLRDGELELPADDGPRL